MAGVGTAAASAERFVMTTALGRRALLTTGAAALSALALLPGSGASSTSPAAAAASTRTVRSPPDVLSEQPQALNPAFSTPVSTGAAAATSLDRRAGCFVLLQQDRIEREGAVGVEGAPDVGLQQKREGRPDRDSTTPRATRRMFGRRRASSDAFG
jgi:hypothetical protein